LRIADCGLHLRFEMGDIRLRILDFGLRIGICDFGCEMGEAYSVEFLVVYGFRNRIEERIRHYMINPLKGGQFDIHFHCRDGENAE